MSADEIGGSKPCMIFIPDITGFTHFVAATEIEHSRHITEELLEQLMAANDSGLEVSEIEGDAILFYRFGAAFTDTEYFAQVRKMFIAFHAQLKLYGARRICDCGACSAAQSLTLKIVAHYGPVAKSQIRQHVKLFGVDVIAAHRLLKNDIPHSEYALYTRAVAGAWASPAAAPWAACETGATDYDVGRIDYGFVALAPLHQEVPAPAPLALSAPDNTTVGFRLEQTIGAPLPLVFAVLTDLPLRLHWIAGAKSVDLETPQPNRLGTRHRCVVDDSSPVMLTQGAARGEQSVVYTEAVDQKPMYTRYELRRLDDGRTQLRLDGLIKNSLLLRVLFALTMRQKLTALFEQSLANLKRYCEAMPTP